MVRGSHGCDFCDEDRLQDSKCEYVDHDEPFIQQPCGVTSSSTPQYRRFGCSGMQCVREFKTGTRSQSGCIVAPLGVHQR